MVFAFSPDSRATLMKLTPRSPLASFGAAAFCCGAARSHRGRAIASTLSSESTSAERLRDFRKTRREGNKRFATWHSARAKIRPYSLYSGNRDFASLRPRRIPAPEEDGNVSSASHFSFPRRLFAHDLSVLRRCIARPATHSDA